MDFAALLSDAFTLPALATVALLVGLELVLGIDNVLVISIVVSRLPDDQRDRARIIGLFVALLARLVFVAGAFWLVHLTEPIVPGFPLSWRDAVLIAGGLFLLWKAVKEIHHVVELKEAHGSGSAPAKYGAAIGQIVLLDMVFSLDSVITAVGMTQNLLIIGFAVIVSFLVILAYAKTIGDFIMHRPALKILALAFLVTIGVTIFLEGMQQHVAKAYIYLPMGFALCVELLQMRHDVNRKRLAGMRGEGIEPPTNSV
ncbi:MAG: TerC family protein [Verrucomicrobia bacterium]|nr:TerC family protein [Verrucomicrobiota bacterium]MDA1203667.1 TerC family protein [Verrucomicrobiota bacterium]